MNEAELLKIKEEREYKSQLEVFSRLFTVNLSKIQAVYPPTRLEEMVIRHGELVTTKKLIKISSTYGFERLFDEGYLRITLEQFVIDNHEHFKKHFSNSEVRACKAKIQTAILEKQNK